MLGFGRHEWRYVTGGSDTYVRGARRAARPASAPRQRARAALRRGPDGVELRTDDGELRAFDAAVVATHADQALRLLEDPSPDESRVLGAFEYTRNEATLHTDCAVPAARRVCARFVELPRSGTRGKPTMTYYLNRLQSLESDDRLVPDAERRGAGRARRRPRRLRASALHRRQPRGSARAAVARRASVGRGSPAPTTATDSTRTASRRACARPRSIGVDW